jgi:hypothetical protein
MHRIALAAAIVAAPLVVHADGDSVDPAIAPPSAVPPTAPPAESSWCAHSHWSWHDGTPYASRFALGMSDGHAGDATEKSLLARAVLHHGFELELELAKAEQDNDQTRTAGATLIKTFGHRHLRPYVLAGAGGGKLDRADGSEPDERFGELGLGIQLRGRHLAIGADIRRGIRHVDDDAMEAARTTMPAAMESDRYTRGRVMALVYF